ncbi:hypothetical protein NJ7G_3986 [Natrinema sp. J7-2]|nr:hypothetical protein NJ7G_3986 [Natrinema sp. J7-2]
MDKYLDSFSGAIGASQRATDYRSAVLNRITVLSTTVMSSGHE